MTWAESSLQLSEDCTLEVYVSNAYLRVLEDVGNIYEAIGIVDSGSGDARVLVKRNVLHMAAAVSNN